MKKTLSFIMALIFATSSIACAATGTQPQARSVTYDTTEFPDPSATNVQAALDYLATHGGGGSGSVNWGDINGILANQVDLQTALNTKISGVNWGQINGTLSNQTDLNTALTGKVPTTRTVNGHALSADVTVTKSDVGLSNVANVDTSNASNISSGTLPNARLSAIPNTSINWASLVNNIQTGGINWQSVKNSEIQSAGINWASLVRVIQSGGVNWQSLVNGEIQTGGVNWASLNQALQATGINWASVRNAQIQSNGINWASLTQSVQSSGINWTSVFQAIQTGSVNWASVKNSEIQNAGINWTNVNGLGSINEGGLGLSDVTTNNASTSKHGFSPKLPNDSSLFYNGIGTFTAPPGSGTINGSTPGYYAQYSGTTTISGIAKIPNTGVNWTSVANGEIQANGVNWTSLNKSIQNYGVNWSSLNQDIQSAGVNWASLNRAIQRGGINWTSLNQDIQGSGINWTSLVASIQASGINWASLVANIQSAGVNWVSLNQAIQSSGINWTSLVQAIQTGGINWASVKNSEILGAGVNWTSVGNVATGGTFTTNGFNSVGNVAGGIKLFELPSNGTDYLLIYAPDSIAAPVSWKWPGADSSGCLQSNGAGILSFGSCGTGGGGGVNSGTQYQLTYYATSGSTVSGNANIFTDASNNLTVGGALTTGGTGQSTLGYGLILNNSGATTINGGDFSFKNSSGTTIFNLGATSGNMTIPVTGTNQCLQVNSSGVVTGTGSVCGGSGSTPGGSTGDIQTNNGSGGFAGLPSLNSANVNWQNINGLAPINNGGINWQDVNLGGSIGTGAANWSSINSIAKVNTGAINWPSVINSVIQTAGVNWASVKNSEIQRAGVNWASLNADIKTTGVNWPSVNGGGTINAGAFTSTTGSGNQIVLATSPTIATPIFSGNVGIGSTTPTQLGGGTELDVVNNSSSAPSGIVISSSTGSPALVIAGDTTIKTPFMNISNNHSGSNVQVGGFIADRSPSPLLSGDSQNDIVLFTLSGVGNTLRFGTESVVRLSINSSGHILITGAAAHASTQRCIDASGFEGWCSGGLAAVCGTCTAF